MAGVAGADLVVTTINKAIQDRLLALTEEKPSSSVEELMESFGKGYEKSVKESPDQPGAWSLKFDAAIRHADGELISLETLNSIFTGGAHPNSEIVYQVFSMKTGKPLELNALLAKVAPLYRPTVGWFMCLRGNCLGYLLMAEEILRCSCTADDCYGISVHQHLGRKWSGVILAGH